MIDPTAELSIDRSGLSLGALVFSGETEIVEMNEPARLARTEYASSRNLHGQVPLRSVYEQANINATVRLESDSAAGLDNAKAALRDALGQFAYDVTQTVNGVAHTYSADMGSMNQVSGFTYENMRRHVEVYTVSIPVYPIASA